ncbi:NAD(P)-dependent alcohol dehydrogenase [Chryseobacterium flavum]
MNCIIFKEASRRTLYLNTFKLMQAIQLENYGIEHLKVAKVPTPEIGENEILVKTTAVSLQYLDLLTVENTVGLNIPLPFIPVSEGVGVVESVGKNVTRWKKGDRVLIPFIPRWEAGKTTPYHNALRTGMQTSGTMAEFTVQPENTLVRTPGNLTDEEATSLSVAGLTAWAMLVTQANIKAGQTILIQGTGGVSLAALQIAKMSGLKVIATTGSKEKEQKLKDLGADEVINYKDFPQWSNEVKRLNNGLGVDITLDVAGNETIEQSILSVKEHGFVGLVGFMSGSKLSFDVFPLIMNYIRLQGYSVGNAQELGDLINGIEKNNLKPVIDSIYTLEQTQEAFQKLKSGKAFGKIVIKF